MPAEDRLTLLAAARARRTPWCSRTTTTPSSATTWRRCPRWPSLDRDRVAYLGTASQVRRPVAAPGLAGAPAAPPRRAQRAAPPDHPRRRRRGRCSGRSWRCCATATSTGRALRAPGVRRPRAAGGRRAVAVRRARRAGRRDVRHRGCSPHDRALRAAHGRAGRRLRRQRCSPTTAARRLDRPGRRASAGSPTRSSTRPSRRHWPRSAGLSLPDPARVTCQSWSLGADTPRPRPRPARARSCGPRKYAVPHSSAKMPPRKNIIGTTKPRPIAATWITQPSGVGPLGAQHAGEQQAGDREPDADAQGGAGRRTSAMVIITGVVRPSVIASRQSTAAHMPRRGERSVSCGAGALRGVRWRRSRLPPTQQHRARLPHGDHRAGDQHRAGAERVAEGLAGLGQRGGPVDGVGEVAAPRSPGPRRRSRSRRRRSCVGGHRARGGVLGADEVGEVRLEGRQHAVRRPCPPSRPSRRSAARR